MYFGDSLELGTIMLQLNAEGLIKATITLMEHIVQKQKTITRLFQGTHTADRSWTHPGCSHREWRPRYIHICQELSEVFFI